MTYASPRRGVTLVELVVAMTLGGIVLALVAAISVRQQRLHADLADRIGLHAQLRQADAVLPIELRGVAPVAGDLRDARDTAVEFRSTIANGIVCDTLGSAVVFAPVDTGASTFASFLTSIGVGDTAWVLTPGDSSDRWTPSSVVSVTTVAGAACDRSGPWIGAAARSLTRISLRLAPRPLQPIGLVVRVTRPMRYSLYRGGDSHWYLGARDWNAAALRFNTIQPVSGPFSSAADRGLELQYFDSAGTRLSSPVASTGEVALIRIAIRGQSRGVMRAFGNSRTRASDSAILVVSFRNRR